MRILQVHNYYQRRGGADETADQEVDLLRKLGHDVQLYSRHNDEIKGYSPFRLCGMASATVWSRRTYREITSIIKDTSPEIVHIQNFFPLISPSVFAACADTDTPVCLTLHDFRLLCPIGYLYRDEKICTECVDMSPWRSVMHRCYRESALKTLPIAMMLKRHARLRTWSTHVSAYSAMTEASKKIFTDAGLPADKILIRPHFLTDDPGVGAEQRSGAVFAGRISKEKGVDVLLKAWRDLPDKPLTIVGDGPMKKDMMAYVEKNNMKQVTFTGFVKPSQVFDYIRKAQALVIPSQWYETFGRTVIEAFATATPVIASRLGALEDLIDEGKTGRLFTHDMPAELRDAAASVLNDPEGSAAMGRNARSEFEAHYSSEVGGSRLIKFYESVIEMEKETE